MQGSKKNKKTACSSELLLFWNSEQETPSLLLASLLLVQSLARGEKPWEKAEYVWYKRSKVKARSTSRNAEERKWTGRWTSSRVSVIYTCASRLLLKPEKWRRNVVPSWGGCTQQWINNKINNNNSSSCCCSGGNRAEKSVACSLNRDRDDRKDGS